MIRSNAPSATSPRRSLTWRGTWETSTQAIWGRLSEIILMTWCRKGSVRVRKRPPANKPNRTQTTSPRLSTATLNKVLLAPLSARTRRSLCSQALARSVLEPSWGSMMRSVITWEFGTIRWAIFTEKAPNSCTRNSAPMMNFWDNSMYCKSNICHRISLMTPKKGLQRWNKPSIHDLKLRKCY